MRHRSYNVQVIFLIVFLIVLLNGCSHTRKNDGPPNYDVDVSNIPNAVPKPEPLAKYGNYKSYVVFGKRYYTMKNSRNYNQVGVASWYGTKFHAHKTSSGEPYDMLGMTAAHKTLPLPTYVEVTNLKNKRCIIVKVNDRGPFESNRIIDLSYVAAKKLGMLGHGTTNVRVRAINPYTFNNREPFFADKSSASPSEERPSSRFIPAHKQTKLVFLQVGAFHNKQYALQLQRRLNRFISSDTLVEIMDPAYNQRLYKVKIGPFRDTAALNEMKYQLKSMGIKANSIYG